MSDAFGYLCDASVNGNEVFEIRTVVHDCLESGVGASTAMTVTKDCQFVADLLDDRCDAIVGDLITTIDEKCFQLCALGGDVDERGICDTDTAIEVDDCDFMCLAVVVDDGDDMLVSQLLVLFHVTTQVLVEA